MRFACFKTMAVGFLFVTNVLPAQTTATIIVKPRVVTAPVISDADDVAIWTHPADPSQSLIIGTDKGTYPDGGIFTWNLDGSPQQRLNISHPNNVDVRHGLQLGNQSVDIAAVSMRDHRQIRIFKIDRDTRLLSEITTLDSANVLNKMFKSPYGLALYKRVTDGFIFVIVSSRHNESKDKLWQIRLEDDGTGRVKGTLVRMFGEYRHVVEGMVADDDLGFFYAAEENVGIHKYYADHQKGEVRLAFFGSEDSLAGNNEGLALYKCDNGTGYLLASRPSSKSIRVYRREGENGDPHQHRVVATVQDANSAAGDGLEVISRPYAPRFPRGLLVWHDQAGLNFRLYAWEEVAQNFFAICSDSSGTSSVEYGSARAADDAAFVILQQNSPNPFNPSTEIRFALRKAGPVQLTIYNLLGEEVRGLLNGSLAPGIYAVRWDATDNKGIPAGNGIYFYRLRADRFLETRRMVLSR